MISIPGFWFVVIIASALFVGGLSERVFGWTKMIKK